MFTCSDVYALLINLYMLTCNTKIFSKCFPVHVQQLFGVVNPIDVVVIGVRTPVPRCVG